MYPGGKDGAGVWQRLVNEIPPHDVFVSAFLGDCALMRRKRPAGRNVGIDRDAAAVARFSALQPGEWGGVWEFHVCDGVEWLRYGFDLESFAFRFDPGAVVARFGVFAERCFVYADPPYLGRTRRGSGRMYRFEMSEDDHCRWLAVAQRLPCRVMISHYPCDLYDEALDGWRSFTFWANTRGGPALEKVWMNYEGPERLHDPRWLGRTRREREKFSRRRENLRAKLLRLPALERQSILDGLE